MKTVLVTGSEGFVGRTLCRTLEAQDYRVLRLSKSLGLDLLDANVFDNFDKSKIDFVVHLAGRSFVPDSWRDPEGFKLANVEGTRRVKDFCLSSGAALLHVSSYVYGPPQYLPVDENHPVSGFNPYAESKIQGERIVQDAKGLRWTIVRPFNIYGPGQDPRFLISQIVRDIFEKDEIVVQSLEPKRDYLFINDFVDAVLVLLARPLSGEIFNLGSGMSVSVQNIVEQLLSLSGKKLQIRSLEAKRENEVMDVFARCRLIDEGVWKPKTSLIDGLHACLDFESKSKSKLKSLACSQ